MFHHVPGGNIQHPPRPRSYCRISAMPKMFVLINTWHVQTIQNAQPQPAASLTLSSKRAFQLRSILRSSKLQNAKSSKKTERISMRQHVKHRFVSHSSSEHQMFVRNDECLSLLKWSRWLASSTARSPWDRKTEKPKDAGWFSQKAN